MSREQNKGNWQVPEIAGAKDFADGKAIAPKILQVLITHQRAKLQSWRI